MTKRVKDSTFHTQLDEAVDRYYLIPSEPLWPGTLLCIQGDEAIIRYEFKSETVELAVGLHVVPEDCRVPGMMCRLGRDAQFEWCREVWMQEDLDRTRARAEETMKALGWGDPLHPTGRCTCAGEGTCDWCQKHCPDCGRERHEGSCAPDPPVVDSGHESGHE